jgi:hypothetical protein
LIAGNVSLPSSVCDTSRARGIGRGGARPGAGRPRARKTKRLADIAAKLALLAQHADRQHRRERAETEALVPILRRLVAIERRLGLVEEPQPPQAQPAAAIGA